VWTALATVAIAAFTLTLWLSSEKMWNEARAQRSDNKIAADRQFENTQDSIKLARDEFISSHRPQLILREAFSSMPEDGPISVQFVITNIGSSRAWIVESSMHLELWKTAGLWLVPETSKQMNLVGKVAFEAGDSKYFIHTSRNVEWNSDTRHSYVEDERGMYFVGKFIYLDERNIHRQTAFRRRYSLSGQRFFRVSRIGEDYEYAD